MQTGNGGSGDRKQTAGDPGGAWMPDGTDHCDRQYPFKAGRAGTDRAGGKAACPVSLLFCGGTDEDRGGGRILGNCTVGDRGGQCLRAGGESLRAGWKAGVWKESPERHDGGGGGKRKSVEIQIGENMEQILVFSGTTEGNALVRALRAYPVHVYVSVATEYGEASAAVCENTEVVRGRMDQEQMQSFFGRNRSRWSSMRPIRLPASSRKTSGRHAGRKQSHISDVCGRAGNRRRGVYL